MRSYVTDRTAEDVTLGASKGSYNETDMNRVTENMDYLAGLLRDLGYTVDYKPINIDGHGRTVWRGGNAADIPSLAQLDQYIHNVQAIRAALAQVPETPPAPTTMTHLTYDQANDIEQVLQDTEAQLTRLQQSWYYSGEIFAGEV